MEYLHTALRFLVVLSTWASSHRRQSVLVQVISLDDCLKSSNVRTSRRMLRLRDQLAKQCSQCKKMSGDCLLPGYAHTVLTLCRLHNKLLCNMGVLEKIPETHQRPRGSSPVPMSLSARCGHWRSVSQGYTGIIVIQKGCILYFYYIYYVFSWYHSIGTKFPPSLLPIPSPLFFPYYYNSVVVQQ